MLDGLLHAAPPEGPAREAQGGVHADAIMDRIVHCTVWVWMCEFNMRQKLGAEK